MAIIYNKLKKEYEKKGYMPFVCIITWAPEEEPVAINRYSQIFAISEGKHVKGVHTWNLIGRNSMIVIGWTNSSVSLQKFCTSITYGTGISMDVCPATDHFGLTKAMQELKSKYGDALDSRDSNK